MDNLFLVDDDQKILTLLDKGEGQKAVIKEVFDMSVHSLEDELIQFDQSPWKSISISHRAITFDEYYFSTQTNLIWKQEKSTNVERLIDERNVQGTLYSMQLYLLKDGSSQFFCKPLCGTKLIDILGQSRTNQKTVMYFANDNKIIIDMAKRKLLFFD